MQVEADLSQIKLQLAIQESYVVLNIFLKYYFLEYINASTWSVFPGQVTIVFLLKYLIQ